MDAGEWRAGLRAMARHRANGTWLRHGAGGSEHTHFTVVGADTTFFDCFRAKY
jgi:hypothetical protein